MLGAQRLVECGPQLAAQNRFPILKFEPPAFLLEERQQLASELTVARSQVQLAQINLPSKLARRGGLLIHQGVHLSQHLDTDTILVALLRRYWGKNLGEQLAFFSNRLMTSMPEGVSAKLARMSSILRMLSVSHSAAKNV